MDWPLALTLNRDALLRVVVGLFAMAGLAPGGSVATLSRPVRFAILRLLRPAESAVRRLIVVAARGLEPPSLHPSPALGGPIARGNTERVPAFRLFDPRKQFERAPARRYAKVGPNLFVPGVYDPVFEATPPVTPADPAISAERLCRRLRAVYAALDDLPRQARRLVRVQARRKLAKPRSLSPLRPGKPPGHRDRQAHEVDDLLRHCHGLALYALQPPDTS